MLLQETPGHKSKRAQTPSQVCIQEETRDAGGVGRSTSKAASLATRPLTQIQALKFISTQPKSLIAAEKWNSLCDP